MVHPDFRQEKVGSRLFGHLANICVEEMRAINIDGDVKTSQLFSQQIGFNPIYALGFRNER